MPPHHYRVAGRWLASPTPIVELAPFARPPAGPDVELPPPRLWPPATTLEPVYRGPGLVGGALREVECLARPDGFEIRLAGLATLAVAADGDEVALLERAGELPAGLVAELLLGPGLVLALARRGSFCLHAGAVLTEHGVVALLGESGHGKSTLAAFLEREAGLGWRRVADDLLPVELTPTGAVALPHFPQLKLAAGDQVQPDLPERLPLVAAVLLEPHPPHAGDDPVAQRLLPQLRATTALLGHTVAGRLFDRELAARHLAAVGRLAGAIATSVLAYPQVRSALPSMAASLAAAAERAAAPAGAQPPPTCARHDSA